MEVIELSSDSNDCEVDNKQPRGIPDIIDNGDDDIIPMNNNFADIRPAHYMSDDDFEFPEVPFVKHVVSHSNSEPICSKNITSEKASDDINIEEELLNKYLNRQPVSEPINFGSKTKRNGLSGHDKELLKLQRLKNAEEAARKKAEKAAELKRYKSMKPGECMKYMKVILDTEFQKSNFEDLVAELKNYEFNYDFKSQIIPNSVTWARRIEENGRYKEQIENQIIVVWNYSDAVKKIEDGTFMPSVVDLQALSADKVVTLVIYGIEDYFKYHKNLKKRQVKSRCQGNKKDVNKSRLSKSFQDLPVITKKKFELHLTDIQLRINCNTQLIETAQHLGLTISQYTKAIAEAPFKKQKKQASQAHSDWYSAADNKDTVKVDKNGNGLKRLWQQQLCQFNLAKLETAEAIISQYPTPLRLMEAYEQCTPSEGAKLLQDIAIRRTAGPLTAIRKIGPELSKKIYLMFTSEDGDVLVGNE